MLDHSFFGFFEIWLVLLRIADLFCVQLQNAKNQKMNVISTSSSELTFSGSEVFKDPENNDITILEKINGLVVTE